MTTAVVLIVLLAAGYGVLRLSGLTLTQARKALPVPVCGGWNTDFGRDDYRNDANMTLLFDTMPWCANVVYAMAPG